MCSETHADIISLHTRITCGRALVIASHSLRWTTVCYGTWRCNRDKAVAYNENTDNLRSIIIITSIIIIIIIIIIATITIIAIITIIIYCVLPASHCYCFFSYIRANFVIGRWAVKSARK
jgi:hypothetical protein